MRSPTGFWDSMRSIPIVQHEEADNPRLVNEVVGGWKVVRGMPGHSRIVPTADTFASVLPGVAHRR
ncbi:hypothetical protein [Actinomadura pelletieri]|uniref:hypothetical protein n=1 Tax=Actinomadura pelletieri TaxID=111805 RepID=UPI0011C49237|nr:hypothetical protein [Actinomadura pelletieri]